ncbi:hypothetical protein KIN20_011290 [Parelaphostrongylus tenuis]|uniref:Uncharacterized protein n=1 Tax=Parelaphostrongylus tenuis TaxID=148309 RepID=A0AAD5N013_PARTN|nr:hypothetical protein KIN20_011290 [Parelaphostrongylus tenuis]
MRVSESWRTGIIEQDVEFARRSHDRPRPCLSFNRLKAESATLLLRGICRLNDSDLYSTIELILFLLHEAELHKKLICDEYINLKKVLEREETTVRGILTEWKVPTALAESLLDAHMKSSGISEQSIETLAVTPSNTVEVAVSSCSTTNVTAEQQCSSRWNATPPINTGVSPPINKAVPTTVNTAIQPPINITIPPVNTSIPPPNALVCREVPSIPLPDLTKPPPVINKERPSPPPFPPQMSMMVPLQYSSIAHGYPNQRLDVSSVRAVGMVPQNSSTYGTPFHYGCPFGSTRSEIVFSAASAFGGPQKHSSAGHNPSSFDLFIVSSLGSLILLIESHRRRRLYTPCQVKPSPNTGCLRSRLLFGWYFYHNYTFISSASFRPRLKFQ